MTISAQQGENIVNAINTFNAYVTVAWHQHIFYCLNRTHDSRRFTFSHSHWFERHEHDLHKKSICVNDPPSILLKCLFAEDSIFYVNNNKIYEKADTKITERTKVLLTGEDKKAGL